MNSWRDLTLIDKILVAVMAGVVFGGLLLSRGLWWISFVGTWPLIKLVTLWGRFLNRWDKFNNLQDFE